MRCENCGANMQVTERTKFCPFCGAKIIIPESNLDKKISFAKYQMEHEEIVRQRIEKDEKHNNKIVLLVVSAMLLFAILCFTYVALFGEEARMDRLTNEVQQLIIQGDYKTAEIKVEGIRIEKQGLFDQKYKKYEDLRNNLKQLIEQKKKESGN